MTNSYARFGAFEAPKYIAWSQKNRSQLIVIPPSRIDNMRMEMRSADPSCNPYLALALILNAGADGIERRLMLRNPTEVNFYKAPVALLDNLDALPNSLSEAIDIAENSDFVRKYVPRAALNRFVSEKREEYMEYLQADNKQYYETEAYFMNI